ncbi:MAG: hypothetical protein E6J41_33310 [Chloroflexi bacterium]|nr:MAG: hypothetical protein E6J41_33310 [Chloroflexota bacterium]
MTMKRVTSGDFTLVSDGTVIGPKDYIESEWYERRIARIEAGTDAVFNYATQNEGQDPVRAILVSLQTHYAEFCGWRRTQAMVRGSER